MSATKIGRVTIKNLTRLKTPRLPFKAIAQKLLPKKYDLSLVLCGDYLSKKLNSKYRKKNKPTNVLSFNLGKNTGEIFLNLRKAREESGRYQRKENEHVIFLYTHAILHILGFDHGGKMEELEKKTVSAIMHR